MKIERPNAATSPVWSLQWNPSRWDIVLHVYIHSLEMYRFSFLGTSRKTNWNICFRFQDKSLLGFTVTAKIRREISEVVLFEIFFGLIMLHVYMNYSISCIKFHLILNIYINSVFLVPSSMYVFLHV